MNRRAQASQPGSAKRNARILVLPGDGIGPEVAEQGTRVLEAAAKGAGIELTFEEGLIGGASIDANGSPITDDVIDRAKRPLLEGVHRVAVAAPQVAARQPHEHARAAGPGRFTLDGAEDLVDTQAVVRHRSGS